jgi:hypothetical protein
LPIRSTLATVAWCRRAGGLRTTVDTHRSPECVDHLARVEGVLSESSRAPRGSEWRFDSASSKLVARAEQTTPEDTDS